MRISATHDSLAMRVEGLIQRMPAELAKALTFTGERVKAAEKAAIRSSFDRPTPRTVNAVYLKAATAQKLEAEVLVVGELSGAGKGFGKITPAKYLMPHIAGGARALKGTEIALRRAGAIGPNQWLVIAANAPKNAYGNLSQGWYQKIISAFSARFDPAQNKTGSRRSRRNTGGIVMLLDEARQPNLIVWRRGNDDLVPLLVVANKAPSYRQRFDWYGIGQKVADDVLPRKVKSAIRRESDENAGE